MTRDAIDCVNSYLAPTVEELEESGYSRVPNRQHEAMH